MKVSKTRTKFRKMRLVQKDGLLWISKVIAGTSIPEGRTAGAVSGGGAGGCEQPPGHFRGVPSPP